MLRKYLNISISILFLVFASGSILAADEEEEQEVKTPAYVSLGDPMVLNLATANNKLTFLQLKAEVLVKDEASRNIIESHIPAIRHQLVVSLSEQAAVDMKTSSKRELIRQQITKEVSTMMENMANTKDVDEILFSTFLVQ